MRKASIIAIIVSAVLMIAGGICCAVGSSAAKKDGFMLFPENENGESVYTYDFTEREINRISVTARDAAVTLSRGGDRSYVTVKNYNANYYRLNEENKTITFAEIDDVLSMFKFWEGFSFKGMRYVFSAGIDRSDRHEIEINLAENDNVRSILVSTETGEISPAGFTLSGDLSLSVKNGKIELSGGKIENSLTVNVASGTLSVSDFEAKSLSLTADSAETNVKDVKCASFKWSGSAKPLYAEAVAAEEFTATSTEGNVTVANLQSLKTAITSASGTVTVSLPSEMGNYSTEIASKTGNIFVDGVQYKLSCTLTSKNAKNSLQINTDSAPVEITSTSAGANGTDDASVEG